MGARFHASASVAALLACSVMGACVLNPDFDPTIQAATSDATGDASGSAEGQATGAEPGGPLTGLCDRLPPPLPPIVEVMPKDAANLNGIIASAQPGTTFVFATGTYPIADGLWLNNRGITLRSASGDPQDVVLDGQRTAEAILSPVASDITIAELTLARPGAHMVHTSGGNGETVTGVTAYRVEMIDPVLTAFKILVHDDGGAPVAGNLAGVNVNNFVSPLEGDLHLVAGSEAIDAGVNLGADRRPHDFDGDVRPDPPDIGADAR